MPIRAVLILLSLAVLSCGRDAPTSGGNPAASSSTAGAAGCPGLAEHWREVWTAEAPKGLERRRGQVTTRVTAMWADACSSVKKEPAQDLSSALTELRTVRTFAAIESLPASGGTATKQALVKSIQDAVVRTKSADAIAPSG